MKILGRNVTFYDLIPPILMGGFREFKRFMSEGKKDVNDAKHLTNRDLRKKFIHSIFGTYTGFDHEDLLIDSLLAFQKKGFYVEIGSNDPNIFPSNTTRFYLKGWMGINIEPQAEAFDGLLKARKRDINLNVCLGKTKKRMKFYELEDRSNGSSLNINMAKMNKLKGEKIISREIDVVPLTNVLEKYLDDREIDFMSVDVESYELEVLMGNNWEMYRPKILIVETLHYNYTQIVNYLNKMNYLLIYNGDVNSIFIDKRKFRNDLRLNPKFARVWIKDDEKIPPPIK